MGASAGEPKELFLVEDDRRPTLTDDERDNAKQVLTVALAAIQRERAAADQMYVRGRNTVAFTATLFVAVQAAFLSSIGREIDSRPLLSASERADVFLPAAIAAGLLAVAVGCLFFWLDRPRPIAAVGAETLTNAWLDPRGEHRDEAVIEVLAVRSIQEESGWARANGGRKRALSWVSFMCGLAGVAVLVELAFLYCGLT